jgi:hypothetical protein
MVWFAPAMEYQTPLSLPPPHNGTVSNVAAEVLPVTLEPHVTGIAPVQGSLPTGVKHVRLSVKAPLEDPNPLTMM